MASVGGDGYKKIYGPNTPINPGNTLGSTTNKYASLQCANVNATNLNVTRRVIAQEFVFGQAYSVLLGPFTLNTSNTTIYTNSDNNGGGFMFLYKNDYSATNLFSFHYNSATGYNRANTLSTGTSITISQGAPDLYARVSSGTMTDVYLKIFFNHNNLSAV
jgi:carotenoid cleavage dioxygenase-like enzyme